MVQTYYIETYGCAANQADSEIMERILASRGYTRVARPEEASVIIVNTCGVKSPTENKIIDRLKALEKYNKPLVVAGCLTKINWRRLVSETSFEVGLTPYSVHLIYRAVKIAEKRNTNKLLLDYYRPPNKPELQGKLPATSQRIIIGTIEIEDGCNFQCSFCATRFARGRTYSYPPSSIIAAVEAYVKRGAIEIRLTGQDVAAYRYEDTDLPVLVSGILNSVGGEYRIRLGMMTPLFAFRIRDSLAKVFNRHRVYKFAHLPVQSGSDRMLAIMRRGHKINLFKELVEHLRGRVDRLVLATDIIVGHPGEEEEDHEKTIRLLEEIKPDIVNLSKYGNRPGTPASRMRQLPSSLIARRSKELYGIILKIMEEKNSEWEGWEGEAFVTARGRKPGTCIARNNWYKPIVVECGEEHLGRRIEVKISGYTPVHLNGTITKVH